MSDFVTITTPDGREVRLPKGMSRQDMAAAMNSLPALEQRSPQSSPSTGQRVKEFFLGDNDPNTQNMGERIGTMLNAGGEAMTFGLVGDEASAAVESVIPGVSYQDRRDHYRKQEEVLERDNPGMSLGAELGGALVGAALPLGAIGTLGRGARLGPRVAASVGAGATMGGTYGFMEGEGLEDRNSSMVNGAVLGGAIGAAAPAIGAGVQRVADGISGRRAIAQAVRGAPTTDQLRAQGNAMYQAVDDAGVQIKPEAFNRTREGILQALRGQGLDELPGPGSLTPKSSRVVQIANELSENAVDGVPLRQVDQLRRHAGTAASDVTNRTESALGSETISQLDNMVMGLGADDVTSGDLSTLQDLLPKARDTWARMSRSQALDDAIENSQNYLGNETSGLRNQFAAILRNPKRSRGYSETEKAMMRRVVQGSMPERLLNLMGGGLGQMGQIGVGAGIGGAPGALAGAATAGVSQRLSERLTHRNAEAARAVIANGGMPQLPVASDATRKIVESLMRRTGAVGPQ